ncbi:MAG: PQQ-binding-like beta-propeller repeat protein, partial [Dehalococcoidia bacterium]|nr:PQQ-binding-like beta-propeller repeat protein [Dehalococcoidia bacterium]
LERAAVQARQLTSVPPFPSQTNPNIPQQLDAIILKALAPHPERRYATPGEFISALAAAAPVREADVTSFKIPDAVEAQRELPGLGFVQAALATDDGPPIVCTICGHSNIAGGLWCTACWGVLERVAAAPGEEVLTSEERDLNARRSSRKRRGILGAAVAAAGVILAIQSLNITLPLPSPTSSISAVSGSGEWAMVYQDPGGPAPIPGESAAIAGQVKWTFETADPIVSVPVVKKGRVYLTTHDNRVVALDGATGDLIWEYATVAPVDSSPAVAGGMVYFGERNKRVIALDVDTGELRWEYVTEGNPTTGSPLVKDGMVYIGSGDGNIYALDALTGQKRWSHLTQDWITNTPALSDNILAVSSLDGVVTIYDTHTGKKRFSFRGLGQPVMGSPIIMEETAYIPYRNGLLAAVNIKEKEVLFQSRWYRLRIQL